MFPKTIFITSCMVLMHLTDPSDMGNQLTGEARTLQGNRRQTTLAGQPIAKHGHPSSVSRPQGLLSLAEFGILGEFIS